MFKQKTSLLFVSCWLMFCTQLSAQKTLSDRETEFIRQEISQIEYFSQTGTLAPNTRYLYPKFRELDARLTQRQTTHGDLGVKQAQWHHQIKSALRQMDGKTPLPELRVMSGVVAQRSGTGVIRGRVRDADSGALLRSMAVHLFNEAGLLVDTDYTDAAGRYLFTDVAPGRYVLSASGGTYSQLFNGQVLCPGGLGFGCQLADLNGLDLVADQDLTGVDFEMILGPKITGQLLDQNTSEPIAYANVRVYRQSDEVYLGSANTNTSGEFTITLNDPFDVVMTFEHSTYLNELYDDITCLNQCDLSMGNIISLASDVTTDIGTQFMTPFGIMSGGFVEEDGGQPVSSSDGPRVRIHMSNGNYFGTVYSQNIVNGQWSADFIPPGDYSIYAVATNHLMELYDQQDCAGSTTDSCDLASGTLVSHDVQPTQDIDFSLQNIPEGPTYIRGRIFHPDGSPANQESYVRLYSSDSWYQGAEVDANGYYEFTNVNPGTYHLIANNDEDHAVAYPGVPGCNERYLYRCQDVLQGSDLVVTDQDPVIQANLTLYEHATVSGRVTDATNQPIPGAQVRINDQHRYGSLTAIADDNGVFEFTDLSHSEYTMHSYANDHQSVAFDQLLCVRSDCSDVSSTVFQVTAGTSVSGFDFTLPELATVNVSLLVPVTNFDGTMRFYNTAGQLITSRSVYSDTEVQVQLPAGGYHVMFQTNGYGNAPLASKVYGGTSCHDDCQPTTGTLLQLVAGQNHEYSLSLDENFKIIFNNNPDPEAFQVYFYDQNNDFIRYEYSYHPNHGPLYFNGLEGFKIELRRYGHLNYYHDQVQCYGEACGLNDATLISPALNQSMTMDYELLPAVSVSGMLTDGNDQPLSGIVELIRPNGYVSERYYTGSDGLYEFIGVPPDTYYLKGVEYAHVNTVYQGLACEPDCDATTGTPLEGLVGSEFTGIDIQLPKMGSIELQQVTTTNQQSLSYVGVQFIDAHTGSVIKTINIRDHQTDPVYLPAGEYLIKTNDSDVIDTGYPSVNCGQLSLADCINQSTLIEVNNGDQLVLTDYVLRVRGRITGTVTDAADGTPVSNHQVSLYDGNHQFVRGYYTGSQGEYQMNNLPAGEYFLAFESGNTHLGELYDDVDCYAGIGVDCLFSDGQTLTVVDDLTSEADFSPAGKPKLNVTVVDSVGLQVLPSSVYVYRNQLGQLVRSSGTSQAHEIALDAGEYYITAYASYYDSKGHPDINCGSSDITTCAPGLVPVSISYGHDVNIQIGLDLQRGISGFVIDSVTGDPIADVVIDVWRYGNPYQVVTSNQQGGFSLRMTGNNDFQLSTDLPPGLTYYNEVYDNIHCFDGPAITGLCDADQGKVISINADSSHSMVLFELDGDQIFNASFD